MNESVMSEYGEFIAINQGDGNFVVYERFRDGSLGAPVWDMWGHKATHGDSSPSPPQIPTNPTIPDNPPQQPTEPSLAGIVGIPTLIAQNVNAIGMSYWRNINQHRGQDILKVFLSINDELVLFTIDKRTLQVLSQRELRIHHTGEGCYFSAIHSDILFVPIGDTLYRHNVDTEDGNVAWRLTDGNKLWQCHSNYDETVHSASIQNANYDIIKWGVSIRGETKYYSLEGNPDECQIDKSGRWLTAKEDNDNTFINLNTNERIRIANADGALGHSDCGFNCAIGENDMSNYAGSLNQIHFGDFSQKQMYSTGIWNMGYVSFTNAKDEPLERQRCLVTTPSQLISVKLDDSGIGNIICDNLAQNQEYENRPKANLCPNGEFAAWTALVNGSRNAYIVRIPLF